MQTWLQDNLMTRETVTEIVVDALDQNSRMKTAGEKDRVAKLVEVISQSRKEISS